MADNDTDSEYESGAPGPSIKKKLQNTFEVSLDKGNKQSFGICIVRGEVKDSPHSVLSGIFIKEILPESPAFFSGKLKAGDRILTLNDRDVRHATEELVVSLIKQAGKALDIKAESIDKKNLSKAKRMSVRNTSTLQENGRTANVQAQPKQQQQPLTNPQNYEDDDDDDDMRDMTGRTVSAAGYEIDRASAANVKRKKSDTDTEEEDEFGYTSFKVRKRYGALGPVHKTDFNRPPNMDIGLALAGHRDRQIMACMIAGVNPSGIAATANLKAGDQILEINGHVLHERCHLNAGVVLKSLPGEKLTFVILRKSKGELAVKPVSQFPAIVDETEYLLTAYKNVRKVQIQKHGSSIGVMIIEGKHAEIGRGIFISDIQSGSAAEEAGLRVGEVILAVNKDVAVDVDYDTAAGMLKRAVGVVTLVISALKTDEEIAEEKAKAEKEEEERQKRKAEAEKPQDPAVAEIRTNMKTIIEIKTDKKPLGVMVVGGKNNLVTTGCVITHVFPEGAIGKDNRLKAFDQILDFNGDKIDFENWTSLKVYQLFNLEYPSIKMNVWRNDPLEIEAINVEITKKPGKDLGLAMVESPAGLLITEIVPAGCPDVESKLQRGDLISKIDGQALEGCPFEACVAFFRQTTGKISLEIQRPKPTKR